MLKDKILFALKKAIGRTSINDKTLSAYVNIIADKIEDESQIETAIMPYMEVLREFQGNINSIAAQAAKTKEDELAKTAQEKAVDEAAQKAAETAQQGNVPEWQKAIEELTKTVETLAGSVTSITAEKTQQTLSQKLVETLRSKEVPDWFYNPAISGRTFKDESEIESFAEGIATGWADAKQKQAELNLSQATRPGGGNGVTGKEVSQKECEEIAKRLIS